MGCCQSTNAAPHDEDAVAVRSGGVANPAIPYDSSRAAINQPTRPVSNVESPRVSASSVPHRDGRPNQSLEPLSGNVAKSPGNERYPAPWTMGVLQQQREQWWDTRVTGSKESWGAVKMVCEMLRQGNIAEAQGILNAANLTCPNGSVVRYGRKDRQRSGVYDERGELYDIPAWLVQDPEDVVEEGAEKDAADGTAGEDDVDKDGEDDGDTSAAAAQRRRDEKGKGRAEDVGDLLTVRARLSDRGTDVSVTVGSKQKVTALIRGVQEQIGPKRVRVLHLGKVFQEHMTLLEQGWVQGHVVNIMVFEGDEGMLGSKSPRNKTKGSS